MVVPDTLKDDRFRDNPLVTGPPHIRFYAGSPIAGPNGHLLGTLCVMDHVPRDFNEAEQEALVDMRKLAETAIEAGYANRERRREQEIFSDTLNMVGHDLRTPLSTVGLGLKLIRAKASSSASIDDAVSLVERGVEQIKIQLESLLTLSQLRAEGSMYTVSMGQQLQEAWAHLYRPEQAQLIVGDLPRVPTVGVSLQHVFQNLLGNALMHGGAEVAVRVSAKRKGDHWYIRVSDNGQGMSDDVLATLFQSAVDTQDSRYHGVGLCIVKRLVEAVGGEVGVHSTIGRGTTLWFSWPALLSADYGGR